MVTVARCLQAARATNAGGCSQMGCCFGCDRATLLREKPLIIPGDTPFRMPSCRCAASARGLQHCAQRASFSSLTRRQSSNFSARRRWHAGKWLRRRPHSVTPRRPGCAMRMRSCGLRLASAGRNALPFMAHDPGARPGQMRRGARNSPCVRAGDQQRHIQLPCNIGSTSRAPPPDRSAKMRAHARAQHLGRPQRRRALERQHLRAKPKAPMRCAGWNQRCPHPARGQAPRWPVPDCSARGAAGKSSTKSHGRGRLQTADVGQQAHRQSTMYFNSCLRHIQRAL
jgi:hypothetical protein